MARAILLATAFGALAFLAGCIPEEGPMMEPGADCMECHDGSEARHWTIAGTWSGQGFHVGIRDANGKTFSLHTNKVGNFWSSEPVTFPLQVSVDGQAMPASVDASGGSCNRCHGFGGGGDGGGNN